MKNTKPTQSTAKKAAMPPMTLRAVDMPLFCGVARGSSGSLIEATRSLTQARSSSGAVIVSSEIMTSPVFQLSPQVLEAVARIERSLGRLEGLSIDRPQPKLRQRNQVKSVQASAQIEGNPLTLEQVTAVLEGQRVVGARKDVQEILNVNAAYDALEGWRASHFESLLAAHRVLMTGLTADAGTLRRGGVGVFRGPKLQHFAPPAHLVHHHLTGLLRWLRTTRTSALIAACVVHYELLLLHPFSDGNGRLARLWQQVVHRQHHPLLAFVPVESVVRDRQAAYYRALRRSDAGGDATPFLEFSLSALASALEGFAREVRPERLDGSARLAKARASLSGWFARADYVALHPRLSTASASRDLAEAVADGVLERRGERRLARYRFRARKTKEA